MRPEDRYLEDSGHQARVAVLSMAQCTAVANLLRAHGEDDHAEGIEEALREASRIICDEVGAEALAEARAWVSGQLCDSGQLRH